MTVLGDGGSLPTDVAVEGLEVASVETYDRLNMLVQSNGDLRLIVDDATRVVPVSEKERWVWSRPDIR